jgi:hypothetical protein
MSEPHWHVQTDKKIPAKQNLRGCALSVGLSVRSLIALIFPTFLLFLPVLHVGSKKTQACEEGAENYHHQKLFIHDFLQLE